MATARPCLAPLSRQCLRSINPTYSLPIRSFSTTTPLAAPKKDVGKKKSSNSENAQKYKKKNEGAQQKKKSKENTHWRQYDLSKEEQFSLLDAMRYLRAWEVGQKPTSVKYELAVRISGMKNGPVVRNRIRLPHPVKTDFRVCVICPPDSKYADAARAAGAVLVGEDEVFDAVKDGKIEFDRCICQIDSAAKMNKSGIGRILGPRGLMPSSKFGTVVVDPAKTMKDMVGASEYRERMGVVRMAIGQVGFTPDELSRNLKAFMESVKKDVSRLSDRISKGVVEVVLSSTNGPGFPLSGAMANPRSPITARELSGP